MADPEDIQCMGRDTGERKQGSQVSSSLLKKSEAKEHSCFPGFQADAQLTTERKLPFPFKILTTVSNKSHGPTSLGKELQFPISLKAKASSRATYKI